MLTYNRIDGMGEVVTALAFKITDILKSKPAYKDREGSLPSGYTILRGAMSNDYFLFNSKSEYVDADIKKGGYWVTYTNPMSGSCYFNEKAFYDLFSLNEFIGIDQ